MVAELVSVAPDGSGQQVGYIPIDKIRSLHEQPQVRTDWRHDDGQRKLDELTQSMRNHGLLQPIEVELGADGFYRVLVGHRRYVAAKRAGLTHVPAVVRAARDQERAELQLVENIHRQDLSAVDEADAYAQVMAIRSCSAAHLARSLGVPESRVQNLLTWRQDTLLREAVQRGQISAHAAAGLRGLGEHYAASLYARLQQGNSVTNDDVDRVRDLKRREGVYDSLAVQRQEREEAVCRLRAEGLSLDAIGKELGLPKATVVTYFQRALRDEQAEPDPLGGNAASALRARRIAVAHALRSQGLNGAAIARALGCSQSAVSDFLRGEPPSDQSTVTFDGVSIDVLVKQAQERERAAREQERTAGTVRGRLRDDRARQAHQLQCKGLSPAHIADALGVSLRAVQTYLGRPAPPDGPNVTLNGVNLDPLIAKAQEHAEHEPQPGAIDVSEPAPHPRPKTSPLPWENQDTDLAAPVVFPTHRAVDGSVVERERGPVPERVKPATPARPMRPSAPADEPLSRLRFMLVGAEQPCLDLMQSVLRVGREQGWSCVELWRNVQAASDLFTL